MLVSERVRDSYDREINKLLTSMKTVFKLSKVAINSSCNINLINF